MNPYEVLGVSPNDDEETIKKAYRALVKKYHPDRYANTPLAAEANEKLKEINRAYDIITGDKNASNSQGGYYSRDYSQGYSGNYSGGEASFQNVRTLITMRMFDAAEAMLERLEKNAEWNFLKGVICMNRGWYQKGRTYIEQACAMEPGNAEYRSVLNQFSENTKTYRTYQTSFGPLACCLAGSCCLNTFCRSCYFCC